MNRSEPKKQMHNSSKRNGKWAPTINISYLIQIKSTPLPWTLFLKATEHDDGLRWQTTDGRKTKKHQPNKHITKHMQKKIIRLNAL